MFDDPASEGMDIQTIALPSGTSYYGATLKTLNNDFTDNIEYVYIPATDAGDGIGGWYEQDEVTRATKVFAPGEGFILINNEPGSSRTIAGQVKKGKPTWELGESVNMTGNITPIELNIQDIKLGTGLDDAGELTGGYGYYEATLKLLNSDLTDDVEYVFIPASDAGDGIGGWYEQDEVTRVTRVFAPGEGFALINNLSSGWMQIPAAIAVTE